MNNEIKEALKNIPKEQRILILNLQSQIDELKSQPDIVFADLIKMRDELNTLINKFAGYEIKIVKSIDNISQMTEIKPDSPFINTIKELMTEILMNDPSISEKISTRVSDDIKRKLKHYLNGGNLS